MSAVIGWDIGGVNTKGARISGGSVVSVRTRPYELQRDPRALVPLLRTLAAELEMCEHDAVAVTMTAELSQMFRTKREGVGFVLDAVAAAFPSSSVSVYAVDGRFRTLHAARSEPLAVAAANWAATARIVAHAHPDAVLIDIGTTSTDIIPIVNGIVVAEGWTDPDRLASGELVYTGALRTPAEAIATVVPFGRGRATLSAEGFALAGDVHVWRGDLDPRDYTCPTPDGRAATREHAGERLARAICADRELIDERGITAIADALADAQIARVAESIRRVVARRPSLGTAVVTGLGAFIGEAAAREAGLDVVTLASELGDAAARCAPAAAVALLLEDHARRAGLAEARSAEAEVPASSEPRRLPSTSLRPGKPPLYVERTEVVDTVVKIGGGLLEHEGGLDAVLAVIADAARERLLVIVPGGGPFADAVREQDARVGLTDDAAHWMAVLAMDQYAHLIASRLPGAALVAERDDIAVAIRRGQVPVLAPSRWLGRADPLPHTWDVTSDSIAAWVAGQLGAGQLVLVKPPRARAESGGGLVDAYFSHTLPETVVAIAIPADQLDELESALISMKSRQIRRQSLQT
jgi:hypothetical protein